MGKFTKDKRDVYYRKAKEDGFRARSAYKLLHIDELYSIFQDVERVIDICAAPGSWTQLIARSLLNETRVISVDLQKIAPVEGVITIQGDITKQSTVNEIMHNFKGNRAQLVVCDGAPDVTGLHDIDQYIQSQLLVAALDICIKTLEKGGTFISKVFKGHDTTFLNSQFKTLFKHVHLVKPKSSRISSAEHFIVCRFYDPPQGFKLHKLTTFEPYDEKFIEGDDVTEEEKNVNEKVFKYITCGDLSAFDEEEEEDEDEIKENE